MNTTHKINKTNIALLLLISLTAIFLSCGKDTPEEELPGGELPGGGLPEGIFNPIQPLAIGNNWVYEDATFGDNPSTATTTIKVTKKIDIKNFSGTAYDWVVSNGTSNIVATDGRAFFHIATIMNGDTLDVLKTWALYPAQVGEKYNEGRYKYDSTNRKYVLTDNYQWTCISLNEKWQVSGNELTIVQYQTTNFDKETITLSYALNVGYAGWEVVKDGKTTFKQRLTSYILK